MAAAGTCWATRTTTPVGCWTPAGAPAANCSARGPSRGTGLGHHYQSPDRLRAIELLEPLAALNDFGPSLYRLRTDVERRFSQRVSFGGGLACLPPWVRRIWRVRYWVWGKLLVNAARVRINNRSYAA